MRGKGQTVGKREDKWSGCKEGNRTIGNVGEESEGLRRTNKRQGQGNEIKTAENN